jgi:3-hydroxyacyl-CoA dehydrogenase/enoyl-CoA hydratase/3-hydroxybutyryl-CoA epimerase
MDRVAAAPKPLVAAIHGACLGGGLELVLAATYRIATDAPATRLGLPEVQLGILPGAGGCQRLPRLIGLSAALDMILTGRQASAAQARRTGLVDDVVPRVILRRVAVEAAEQLAGGWRPQLRRKGLLERLSGGNPVGRAVVFRLARRKVLERTGGHYPAPLAALDAVRRGIDHGLAAGLAREAELFGDLAVGDTSRHLVQLFFATTRLKKDSTETTGGAAPRSVDRVAIVGAGFMGAGIAGVSALTAGVDVRLRDTDGNRAARGVRDARRVIDDALRRRKIDRHEHYRRIALVSGAADGSGFARRDLIVEAVFEDLAVKRAVISEIEQVVPDVCIIASNTSTLSIARLQEGAARPGRVLGMHFFSPVERMPLVEVIPGPATDGWVVATTAAFGRRLGKTVIFVRDAPGFWVNRILAPYLNEACWLADEGVPIEAIDGAMVRFGFPVGPMTLLDEVGLDVAEKASRVLHEAFGDRLSPAPAVARLVAGGRSGRKSGRGFYMYKAGRKAGVDRSVYRAIGAQAKRGIAEQEIQRRCVLALLNEAARAFSEGVVPTATAADVGAVLGFGFPPFLGGPLRHLDDRGAAAVTTEIETLAARYGPRLAPCDALVERARSGRRFHE